MSEGQPSILYASPMCTLDFTSGAAISIHALLASLAARGFRAVALEAQLFDSPQGGALVEAAAQQAALAGHPVLQTTVLGVEHLMVRTVARQRPDMTSREEEFYIDRYRKELRHRRPDMVILWGDLLLESVVMREARALGIPVVFYLASGGYQRKETFQDVSVIVTDTQATADLYKERLGLDCIPVGKFIDPAMFKARERKPQYITFINPAPEKGVNVFMPLARLAAREAPDVKFLVVQGRGRWDAALKSLHCEPGDFPNVQVIEHQQNMLPVYGATRALLVPSVWHESGGRVIVEALINGIPVLASRSGGPPELVGQAGRIFDLPDEVRRNRDVPAAEAVVRPWLQEIERIWRDPVYYAGLTAKADEEALKHDIGRNTERFLAAVQAATQRRLGRGDQEEK
ncbi:glycosyltransferase family 4 protein [Caenimonas koreensis]|uniref:glycosyltransferase family 4 protein n=1 Tax=Caenimonas koreensis TaxID=367474 RepID=UPI003783A936